jgi:hypothetical protein
MNPMQEMTTWVYFFPVTIRAKYILIFLAAESIFGVIIPMGNVAHAAHLGGILFGLAYVRWGTAWESFIVFDSFKSKQPKRKSGSARKPYSFTRENPAEVPEDEFISREVDPILDKISQHGIQSLTDHERKVLEAARNKMAKR